MTTVGVVGLGRLGLPFAYTLAGAGHQVFGWDTSEERRTLLAVGDGMPEEVGLPDLMRDHRLIIAEPKTLAEHCDVVFIIVPTPSRWDGAYDPEQLVAALTDLDVPGHLGVVSVVSTVSPGTCRELAPRLETQGRRLVYSPALVSLHSVVTDLRMATVWILGCDSEPAGRQVAAVLREVSHRADPVLMSYDTAELAKMAVNMRMMLDIAFVNQLQRMAWLIGPDGGDVDAITTVLHLTARRAPMLAGAGYGGPCLPRDGAAFQAAGGAFGYYADHENETHLRWVCQLATEFGDSVPHTFAVLGAAYKEGGTYTDASFGLRIADQLTETGLTRVVALADADVVIIALPLRGQRLANFKHGARVLDLWRSHSYLAAVDGLRYLPVGGPLPWQPDPV